MMLLRLTGAKRLTAGWLVAMTYMLCVLAPTLSFALPGSQAIAPCLIDATYVPGTVQVHHDVPAMHVHQHGHTHDYPGGYSHANSSDDRLSMSIMPEGKSAPDTAPHSSDGQCCGLMCVSALPATLINIVKLTAPTARCEISGDRKVGDNAPRRLYRPPIS